MRFSVPDIFELLLDIQVDERLARFQLEYEKSASCTALAQLMRNGGDSIASSYRVETSLTAEAAARLQQQIFDDSVLATELAAAPRAQNADDHQSEFGVFDGAMHDAKERGVKNVRRVVATLTQTASNDDAFGSVREAVARTSELLLRLTRCEGAMVRASALRILLRQLSQREAFFARLRQVRFVTCRQAAAQLRLFGNATSEFRRLHKWVVAGKELSNAHRVVSVMTNALRGAASSSLGLKQDHEPRQLTVFEIVRHAGTLERVVAVLRVPLVLRDQPEKYADGRLKSLPTAVNDDHKGLVQVCLNKCAGGPP